MQVVFLCLHFDSSCWLFMICLSAGVTQQPESHVCVTLCYLLADVQGEHMPLPAEVLPQLLYSSALSGQPEAQGGLWILCEGTGGNSPRAAEDEVRAVAK